MIKDQFTADPTARLFNGKIYVYPSHDIVPPEGEGRAGWFNMADYHVFSSADLVTWEDHGVILSQKEVPWADKDAYSMWAPDAVEKNGKYYFYFPTRGKGAGNGEGGFSIGVATADKPEGPFIPQEEPIQGVTGIDPNVFIDKDGQAYLYWSQGKIYGARLQGNMLSLASDPIIFRELPQEGHIEGPFVFEREGIYYLTYPHVANKIERLEYATGNDPLGPFTPQGVIMDESDSGTWTNHHSITEFKDQWILFYHDNDLSPDFDKNRSIKADSLFFNKDGSIQKVIPSLRGVGVTDATQKIEIDRYSGKSPDASVAFIEPEDTFKGWYIALNSNEWVQYNQVEFPEGLKKVKIRASSGSGGVLQLRLKNVKGPVISEITVPENKGWTIIEAKLQNYTPGKHNLVVVVKQNAAKVDWVSFSK
ncbi:family 43 glycosylhydrolase [Zunongwangia sp. F363]|uniref:Family 43 glycosylhydrolase n=1 Tax=Autumnicola tepida TaxID=3075595 RepID=A0ABU3CAT9_9FLAO|nr:family 43 glycosylhydrolase [Zunongwangia sp. F363]MDT0643460.1 family 43 glycosylhydrolase [Zunongwangia sp. F363]